MDGSVHTEQMLLEEIQALRSKVAELEQREQKRNQEEKDPPLILANMQNLPLPVDDELKSLRYPTIQTGSSVDEYGVALDAVFETITDGLAVYDVAGNLLRANLAFYQMLGTAQPEDYKARSLHERGELLRLQDERGELLPAELWPTSRILRGEVIVSGEAAAITFITLDNRKIQTDVSGAPIRNTAGAIIGAVIVFHDVTLRNRIERRTHNVLNALLEMAEALVQGTDKTSTDVLQSKASLDRVLQRLMTLGRRILRCPRIGITFLDPATELLHPMFVVGPAPEEMQRWQALLAEVRFSDYFTDERQVFALRSGQAIHIDLPASSDRKPRAYLIVPILMRAQLIGLLSLDYGHLLHKAASDELVPTAAISKLIALVLEREQLLQERAELQASELALAEANRRMDEFLSIASHELRTPLTTINGNIQLAKRRVKMLPLPESAPPVLREKLDMIEELLSRAERQVRIQNRLVGDLLDVSRIHANHLELEKSFHDLAVIVRDAVEDQRTAAPSRVIRLTGLPADLHIPIFADADRITQTIINFLTNALKYSESTRPVEVCVTVESGYARVSVRDEGPGLPVEAQEKLWERFYRVPGIVVQSGSGVGLGLGLHICRTIIEQHDGHVGVESIVGKGSTFWFTLPLVSEEFIAP